MGNRISGASLLDETIKSGRCNSNESFAFYLQTCPTNELQFYGFDQIKDDNRMRAV